MKKQNKRPLVFMFSGQGSHYYHMASDLFETHSLFKGWMELMDKRVQELIGESVLEKLYDAEKKKSDPFNRMLYTNPAIFMLQYSLAQVFIADSIRPDYVLGASLGEFVAAAVSGVASWQDVLEAVVVKAQIMEEQCPPGGMMAILASPDKQPAF